MRWICVVGSGVLLGLSYPPFPSPALAWIALVPLLLVWERVTSGRRAFVDAYVALLVTFAVAFQWPLFHAFRETALLSVPGLLILPMWMAVPFGLSVPFRRRLGRLVGLLALGCGILLIEFAMRRGPLAFPWTLLGHTQADFFPINRLAAFGGVPALTAFVFLMNATASSILFSWMDNRHATRVLVPGGWFILIVSSIIFLTAGEHMPESSDSARTRHLSSGPPDQIHPDKFRIAFVQPGIAAESWADVDDSSRVTRLLAMSEGLSDSVDLVIWPETAIPPSESVRERIERWVGRRRQPLIAGAIVPVADQRPDAETGGSTGALGSYYNAALAFDPHGPERMYAKERLVPFAEHVPLQLRWPWLRKLAIPSGGVRSYEPGNGNEVIELAGRRVGVLICFESLFDDQARAYVARDADLIVTLTQDGWWGNSFGYRQHLSFTRLRAIETGLPVVQTAVSGISALIYPDGRILERIGWMDSGVRVVEAPQPLRPPFYARYGDWLSLLAFGVASVLAILLITVRNQHGQKVTADNHHR